MLNYSLLPQELDVTIDGKAYILREASEAAAVAYRDVAIAGATMQDGKVVGVKGIAKAEPLLVSMCLFLKTDKGEQSIALNMVNAWPARVVADLFAQAKKISQLDDEETLESLKKQLAEVQAKIIAKTGGVDDESSPKN